MSAVTELRAAEVRRESGLRGSFQKVSEGHRKIRAPHVGLEEPNYGAEGFADRLGLVRAARRARDSCVRCGGHIIGGRRHSSCGVLSVAEAKSSWTRTSPQDPVSFVTKQHDSTTCAQARFSHILKRAETCCVVKHATASSCGSRAETCCGLRLLDASYSYKNDYTGAASQTLTSSDHVSRRSHGAKSIRYFF
jgi:hypothetical protein